MARPQMASASVVVLWSRLYTAGLPAAIRDRRREEIGADVREQLKMPDRATSSLP
jgi:hypothetical protein